MGEGMREVEQRIIEAVREQRRKRDALVDLLDQPGQTIQDPDGGTVLHGPWSQHAMQEWTKATKELERALDEYEELIGE